MPELIAGTPVMLIFWKTAEPELTCALAPKAAARLMVTVDKSKRFIE